MVSTMLIDNAAQIIALLRSGQIVAIGGSEPEEAGPGKNAKQRCVSSVRLILAFAAVYLIWGSTYLAIRYAVETIPPLLMMGARHLTAGTLLYVWLRQRGTPAPLRAHWKHASVAGAFLFLGSHGSLAWAEQKVPSGLAALLCATLPLWIVLLTRLMDRKRSLSGQLIAGLFLGFAGVGILIGPAAWRAGSSTNLIYIGIILAGAFLWAVGTIYTQRVSLPPSSGLSAAMQMIAGGVALFGAGFASSQRLHLSEFTPKSVFSLGYLIVFGSLVAFTAFTWLHKVSSPMRISTYAYVNPVVAVFVGWLLAGEALLVRTLVATVIILAGVAVVNFERPRTSEQLSSEQPSHAHGAARSSEPEFSSAD